MLGSWFKRNQIIKTGPTSQKRGSDKSLIVTKSIKGYINEFSRVDQFYALVELNQEQTINLPTIN